MAINWDGDILPCCEYVTWSNTPGFARYVHKQGDEIEPRLATTSSVTETWNSQKIINMRVIHKTRGRTPIAICAGCSKTGIEYKY